MNSAVIPGQTVSSKTHNRTFWIERIWESIKIWKKNYCFLRLWYDNIWTEI